PRGSGDGGANRARRSPSMERDGPAAGSAYAAAEIASGNGGAPLRPDREMSTLGAPPSPLPPSAVEDPPPRRAIPSPPHPARMGPRGLTDHELLDGIRRGDRESFERLFRAHYPGLLRYAEAQLGDPMQAEDAVHD